MVKIRVEDDMRGGRSVIEWSSPSVREAVVSREALEMLVERMDEAHALRLEASRLRKRVSTLEELNDALRGEVRVKCKYEVEADALREQVRALEHKVGVREALLSEVLREQGWPFDFDLRARLRAALASADQPKGGTE